MKRVLQQFLKQEKGKSRPKLIKALDKKFSDYMKNKADGVCFKCKQVKPNAGVSHYFSRKYMGTRWSVDNCDWACWGCHYYQLEHFKQPGEWYYNYMIDKLGMDGFEELEILAHAVTKYSMTDLQLMINNFDQLFN